MSAGRTLQGVGREFLASGAVGVVATAVDLFSLTFLIEVLALGPQLANLPALALGAIVQFVGSRGLVFRASAGDFLARNSWLAQGAGFSVVELGTLALNGVVFSLLMATGLCPYVIARVVSTFLVFAGFSFPLWRCVFRATPPPIKRGASRRPRDIDKLRFLEKPSRALRQRDHL